MRPREIILRNSARCVKCGDKLESRHRHDFRRCRCGALGVDGGHAYIRRIGAGQDTSIVAIREVDDTGADNTRDFVDQIRSAWRPTSSAYEDAPLLQNWRTHVIEVNRAPAQVLIGTVSGHPEFPDGTLIATGRVLARDIRRGWARTTRRYYKIGNRQTLDSEVPDQPRTS